MSRNIREEINDRINIVDIVGKYLTLKRTGSRYTGLCPFHNEKTPSFTVTPDKNLFYCYGCHKGGSVFDFVMEMENMEFPEALRFLAEKAGVEVEPNYRGSSDDRKKRDALKELYKRVSGSFEYILEQSSDASVARAYLDSRGVKTSIIKSFGLGWAPDDRKWLLKFLKSKGYSDGFLKESGLFSQRGLAYPLFSGRIMFPLKNYNGEVVAFSGRTLKDFGPKYINSPETEIFKKKRNLYGLSQAVKKIRENNYSILCEGQMDVIAYHQAGVENAVAPLGTAYTEEQAMMLKRYSDNMVISFDGDKAGIKAAEKAVVINEKKDIKSKVAVFRENEDPADLLLNMGQKALQKVLKSTINSFDYILDNAVNLSNINSPEGKEEVIQRLGEYLKSLNSEVRRQSCIKIIAEKLDVNESSVYRDIETDSKKEPRKYQNHKSPERSRQEISAEMYLMIAVVVSREYYAYVRGRIDLEDLNDPGAREIFIALEESYRNEEKDINSILARLDDEKLVSLIAEKVTSEEYSINSEEIIKDSVRKIRRSSLLKKREDVVKKLKSVKSGNEALLNETELLSEKIFIDREIEKLRLGI